MSPRLAPAAFQWLVFPLVMSAAVAWSLHAMANGGAAPSSILVPQLSAFAVVALLEHVYPYHRAWNQPRRDVRVDATHSIIIALLVALATPFVLAGGVLICFVLLLLPGHQYNLDVIALLAPINLAVAAWLMTKRVNNSEK